MADKAGKRTKTQKGEEMKDQASGLRLLMAIKREKDAGNLTIGRLAMILREHGYTGAEYEKLKAATNQGK